jgi:UDP-N-acetylmuramyl pentapeptide synthase
MKVKGIQNDSHDVHEGDIYVCEVGPYHNGHHFLPEAVTRGASLIIAKLMLPGAELAMVADIGPEDEAYKVQPTHQSTPWCGSFNSATSPVTAVWTWGSRAK